MSENPPVNRALKDRHFDHIDHALGRPTWPLRESYRNHFSTEADSADGRAFCASAHWEHGRKSPGGLTHFYVTETGKAALAEHLAALATYHVFTVTFDDYSRYVVAATASKARYYRWADLRDILPDLTFGDFQKRTKVRRTA